MTFEKIKQIENEHYFNLFSRNNICLTHGSGSKVYDTEGREYTDFLAGIAVNCLGHCDKDITDAVCNQAKKLMHVSNLFYTQPQSELIERLTSGTGFDRAFLCNSGAEANEAAIKLVRKYFYNKKSDKYKIITAQGSFHGRTITTAAATGQPKYSEPYKPLTPGFVHVPFNDCLALTEAMQDGQVSAVMLEAVQGEGGVISASKEYMQLARKLTKETGALLIIDEVQTGIMRCGTLFCFEQFGISPDIITLAKGLGGGFPIGAALATESAASAFDKGDHGTTFGGNPLACAAANAVLKKVTQPAFKHDVNFKAEFFKQMLTKFYALSAVEEIKGIGLLLGLKLSDKVSGRTAVSLMLERGFIINCAGNNTLRFVPPLNIGTDDIEKMCAALYEVLSGMQA